MSYFDDGQYVVQCHTLWGYFTGVFSDLVVFKQAIGGMLR